MSRRGWLLFLALGFIWGTPYLMIRVAVREVDPATLLFMRTALASALFVPLMAWRGTWRSLLPAWRWIGLYALVEMGIPWLLMGQAETRISSSLTGLLVATVPLIAAVATRVTHPEERLGWYRGLGLLLGTVGVAVLVGIDVRGATWTGVGLMLVVATGYAIGPIIISLKLTDLPGPDVVGSSVVMVALAYAPYGLGHLPSQLSAQVAWCVLGLAAIPTVLGFLAFFYLIKEVGPHRSTMVTYLNPVVAVAFGVLLLHEPLTAGILLGFPLIVAGAYMATSRTQAATVEER